MEKKQVNYFLFIFKFSLISLFLYLVPNYYWLQRLHTLVLYGMLLLSGFTPIINGITINGLGTSGYEIVKNCTGVQVMALLIALALLTKMNLRKKVLASLWIFSGVTVMDIFRIFFHIIIDVYGILPWAINHDILGRIASGVLGSLILILFLSRLFPPYKDSVMYLFSLGRD